MQKTIGLGLLIMLFGGLVLLPRLQAEKSPIGDTRRLPANLQRAFSSGKDFSPLPKPQPGDWLSQHREPGQTYSQFLRSKPNRPGVNGRSKIVIQPLGDFPTSAPSLKVLKEFMTAYYHPMVVELAEPFPVISLRGVSKREHFGQEQWQCVELLDFLEDRVPKDAHVLMAVTMTDLYPGPDWNFVFGMARLRKRVGVFSFARYGDEPQKAMKRAMKVIAHETGHAFGVKHCIHYHCLMNGSNSLPETDRAPLHFCPVCLRKIHWGLRFDPAERYRKLAKVVARQGLGDDAAWFLRRAKAINEPTP